MDGEPLRILGVHGVKNYQDGLAPAQAAERLAGWWRAATCKGLGLPEDESCPLSMDLAYYAHRLHLGTAQGSADFGLLEPEVQELIVAWASLCGAPQETAQGRLSAPRRAAVEWVANRYGLDHKLARILAAVFFREVNTYFTNPERRAAAIADVAAAIERTCPDIIVAHSLGSVVAYETRGRTRTRRSACC